MRLTAHADKTRNGPPGVALAVTRRAKNTPTGSLTAPKSMRVLPIVLWAVLGFAASGARAACNEAGGCADTAPIVVAATAEAAGSAPIQVAEVPVSGVTGLTSGDAASPARVATVADARPGGTLLLRSDGARTAPRASDGGPARTEPRTGSERSSVWMMLLAGLAFAVFVIAKRTRG
jgi:hypothetical protein